MILEHSLAQWGEEGQRAYADSLEEAFSSLRAFPEIGRRRDDIAPELRSSVVRKHLILYRFDNELITVTRIVHQSVDVYALGESLTGLAETEDDLHPFKSANPFS